MVKHNVIGHNEHFWFVYFLGVVSGATGIFLFGTKKGREVLEQIIEFAEDFEGNLEDIIANIDGLKDSVKNEATHLTEKLELSPIQNSLTSIIEKIGSTVAVKERTKRMRTRKVANLKSA